MKSSLLLYATFPPQVLVILMNIHSMNIVSITIDLSGICAGILMQGTDLLLLKNQAVYTLGLEGNISRADFLTIAIPRW